MSKRNLDGSRVLVTGGAGFIGSHLVERLLGAGTDVRVTTLDALTYAGNVENLASWRDEPRHRFVHGDVRDAETVLPLVAEADIVCHLAAETHVDRSIVGGVDFVETDAVGTAVLLEAIRREPVDTFLHVSTDEVYGEISGEPVAEDAPLRPRNPYSASKAAADHLAHAYRVTHELPVRIARPSNHYGPRQYPEKLIPLFIVNATLERPLPLYGDGRQVREWTWVEDGVEGLVCILERGEDGAVYNVGSGEEHENLEVARSICDAVGADRSSIRHVTDRPGHDRRYALRSDSLRELGWKPGTGLREGIDRTVAWYLEHRDWWEPIVRSNPEYQRWISAQYTDS